MCRLTLADGTALSCEGVNAAPVTYLGTMRDTLTFTFDPDQTTLSTLLEAFTTESCKTVTIKNETGIYIHEHYTIRIGAGMGCRDLAQRGQPGLSGSIQDTQSTVWVTMAQSTLEERTLLSQQAAIDALVLAALEV